MQHDHPLTLQLVLERMRRLYAETEVVSVRDGERTRATYAEVVERADRLCAALDSLGVGPGDRVATFSWNTREHLEAYLAVPCMGAVLHTLNVRLFQDQLEYVVGHAEDKVILVEDSLVPVLEELAPRLDTVRHYVVIGDGDAGSLPDPLRYEELLAAQRAGLRLPGARRPPGGGPLLHERDHRQSQGRALLAPLQRAARDGAVHGRLDRHALGRSRHAGGADVPRERLGHPVRLGPDRRRPW